VCGTVNRLNCIVWESENLFHVIEYERDSPKVNQYMVHCDEKQRYRSFLS